MGGTVERECVLAGAAEERMDGKWGGRAESGFEREQRTPVEGTVGSGEQVHWDNLGYRYQVRAL